MEEIRVGEYIRTKNGVIAQFTHIETYYKDKIYWFDNTIYQDYEENISYLRDNNLEKYIKKHSFNIIDLIEVGDYVNGYRVVEIMEDMKTGEIHLEMTSDYTNQEIGDCTIYNKDIKTIVTKEMMASVEYKVEAN